MKASTFDFITIISIRRVRSLLSLFFVPKLHEVASNGLQGGEGSNTGRTRKRDRDYNEIHGE